MAPTPDYVKDKKRTYQHPDNCTELDDSHFLEAGGIPFKTQTTWRTAAAELVTRGVDAIKNGREAVADYIDAHPRLQRAVWGAAAFARSLSL